MILTVRRDMLLQKAQKTQAIVRGLFTKKGQKSIRSPEMPRRADTQQPGTADLAFDQ